jgi:hypothetical protein
MNGKLKMKNSVKRFNSKLDPVKERISEIKDIK